MSSTTVSIDHLLRLSSASKRLISVAKRLNDLAQRTEDEQARRLIIDEVKELLETVDDANLVVGEASERTTECRFLNSPHDVDSQIAARDRETDKVRERLIGAAHRDDTDRSFIARIVVLGFGGLDRLRDNAVLCCGMENGRVARLHRDRRRSAQVGSASRCNPDTRLLFRPCRQRLTSYDRHPTQPDPQLLDHRPYRPRQVHPRRPPDPDHRRADRARDDQPGARQHGARAGARDHHQGPDRPAQLQGQRRRDL